MSTDYYLLNDAGERTGPHTLEQVSAMWVEGTVTFDTLHWSEGLEDWKPLRVFSNEIHAARRQSAPGSAKKSPLPLSGANPAIASDGFEQPVEKEKYYLHNDAGEKTGPYTLGKLSALWVDGTVTFDTLHWAEGMEDWKPLRVISTEIHAARRQSAPGSAKKSPLPLATANVFVASEWAEQPVEKGLKSFFNWHFLYYTSLVIFVLSLMAYCFSPEVRTNVNEAVHKEYATYFPPPPEEKPHPQPVVVAPPNEQPKPLALAVPIAPPEPPQKYSLDEIKKTIQNNLIDKGVIQVGATCDWQSLVYTDDTDVRYELLAHVSGGGTKFCTGMVALNPTKHDIVLSSQLSD